MSKAEKRMVIGLLGGAEGEREIHGQMWGRLAGVLEATEWSLAFITNG